jgi:hypothetical protein
MVHSMTTHNTLQLVPSRRIDTARVTNNPG